jgi:hypothetical protein
MLGQLNASVERLGGVVRENRDAFLSDDGAGIHAGVNEMDGASGFRNLRTERLFPRSETWEGWEQRGVNIDDALRKSVQQRRLDHAHVACEHDEIRFEVSEIGGKGGFGFWGEFGFEGAFWDGVSGDAMVSRDLEDAGLGIVRTDGYDGCGERARVDCLKDCSQVGAASGPEDG